MKSDVTRMCRSWVTVQASRPPEHHDRATPLATLTLSRQAGARGRSLARLLAAALNRRQGLAGVPWSVFDRELMERVMREHDLPPEMARFFPEAKWNEVESTINTLLHRHPDSWTVFAHTVETIRKLARGGHAIIVGRGANFIAHEVPHLLHLRLIGSPEARIAHLCASRHWSEAVARTYVESEDRNRRAFVRQHFGADIDDPAHYSLILNTDHLSDEHILSVVLAWVDGVELEPARREKPDTQLQPSSIERLTPR